MISVRSAFVCLADMSHSNAMFTTGARRERLYRQRHLGTNGDLARVTLYLGLDARDRLARLSHISGPRRARCQTPSVRSWRGPNVAIVVDLRNWKKFKAEKGRKQAQKMKVQACSLRDLPLATRLVLIANAVRPSALPDNSPLPRPWGSCDIETLERIVTRLQAGRGFLSGFA
jgi:hypothetical protein